MLSIETKSKPEFLLVPLTTKRSTPFAVNGPVNAVEKVPVFELLSIVCSVTNVVPLAEKLTVTISPASKLSSL